MADKEEGRKAKARRILARGVVMMRDPSKRWYRNTCLPVGCWCGIRFCLVGCQGLEFGITGEI